MITDALILELRKKLSFDIELSKLNIGVSIGIRPRQHEHSIVVTEIAENANYDLEGEYPVTETIMQIDCWSTDERMISKLFKFVKATLPNGRSGSVVDDDDTKIQLWGCTRLRSATRTEKDKDSSDMWHFRHSSDWSIHYEDLIS